MWVRNQRNSWHGVDFPYQGEQAGLTIPDFYKRYAETLLAVDEGIGQIIELLKQKGLYENTLIAVMGDNGFAFGEHGLGCEGRAVSVCGGQPAEHGQRDEPGPEGFGDRVPERRSRAVRRSMRRRRPRRRLPARVPRRSVRG